jgi:hypothetical protein
MAADAVIVRSGSAAADAISVAATAVVVLTAPVRQRLRPYRSRRRRSLPAILQRQTNLR